MKGSPWALREISTLQMWKKMTAEVIIVALQRFQNWGQLYRKCQWHWRSPVVSLWMCYFLLTVVFLLWLPRHQWMQLWAPKAPKCSCWASKCSCWVPKVPCSSSCSPVSERWWSSRETCFSGHPWWDLPGPQGLCSLHVTVPCWLVWVQLWGWGGQHSGTGLQAQPCWWLGPGGFCAIAFMKKEAQLSFHCSLRRNGLLLSSENYRPHFQPLQ